MYQLSFAQKAYNEVFETFYTWFFNVIEYASSFSDSNLKTALVSIFFNCDTKDPKFLDKNSIIHEQIRSLGGYQIEIGKILNILQNPNVKQNITCPILTDQIKDMQKKYNLMVQTGVKNQDKFDQDMQIARLNAAVTRASYL